MKKTIYVILPLLLLALFVAGCGKEETPTGEVTAETESESETMEGEPCETNVDCGVEEPLGDSFCLGNSEYQRYKMYRCGFREKVCESYERDKRIGPC